MKILALIKQSMDKWGSDFKITKNGQTIICKGFIQPLRYKNNMYLGGKRLDTGYFDGGHYLVILDNKADLQVHDKALIEDVNGKYIIKRAENIIFNNEKIYVWAILKPYFEMIKEDFTNDGN